MVSKLPTSSIVGGINIALTPAAVGRLIPTCAVQQFTPDKLNAESAVIVAVNANGKLASSITGDASFLSTDLDGALQRLKFNPSKGDEFVLCPVSCRGVFSTAINVHHATAVGLKIAKAVSGLAVPAIDVVLPSSLAGSACGVAARIWLGFVLGGWKFVHLKKDSKPYSPLPPFRFLVDGSAAEVSAAIASATSVAEGSLFAKDLVNAPPNVLYPETFADICLTRFASIPNVDVEVLDEAQMAALGMHCILAVGAGSRRAPRLVVIRYKGAPASDAFPTVIVGKGVCMDTGGINVKAYPAGKIQEMKTDMGGAAVAAGTLYAVASSKAPINVAAVLGCVENMPDGAAYRPCDVIRSAAGLSVEIHNTDAEGRVVLADALWYAQTKIKGTERVIDLATLTGACIVALGNEYAAMYSNEAAESIGMPCALRKAGESIDEKVWPMPYHANYDAHCDSPIADVRNVGRFGVAGSITAACFLRRFINPETAWIHLDIAGVHADAECRTSAGGFNGGWGVHLLYSWLLGGPQWSLE